jgi:hypothetical protein
MKFHPYSEVFPLIEGAEFDALVADIKEHGLREKIWLYEGKILDGRNRFLACKRAGVRPLTRKYRGKDALAFVVSANMQRRHLTVEQRALAAAKVATLAKGTNQHAPGGAPSQTGAAESFGVSRRSVQRAKDVIEQGSKALQQAVESGEVALAKAAAVVDLPKSEQLKAATQKPAPTPDPADPERPDDVDEDAALAAAEADYGRRVDAVMGADDKLSEARAQLKQQAALIGTLEATRDSYMRGKEAVTKLLKAEQRKVAKLEKENGKLLEQIESMRERIAIMEQAA